MASSFWDLCSRLYPGTRRKHRWDGELTVYHAFDPPLTTRTLVNATGNFSDEYLLARGGLGNVYKAVLPDGTAVAVDRLRDSHLPPFHAEMIKILGNARHPNLVRLLASYVGRPPHTEHLLVYEFLPGGSLDTVLMKELDEDSPLRSFPVRHRICTEVARGLNYLHHDSPGIVHRDMKPANVLLDGSLTAYVSNFDLALAMPFEEGKDHMTVEGIIGTPGFAAPEYMVHGYLGFKTDVYAYGITLLQVMSRRRIWDEAIVEKGVIGWASGGTGVLDPLLVFKSQAEEEMANGVIQLALRCIARDPGDRLGMDEVVRILENECVTSECCIDASE